jgi:hypothetical protein
MKKTARKLSLNIETIRRLTKHDLELVVGGKCPEASGVSHHPPAADGTKPPPPHDIPTC